MHPVSRLGDFAYPADVMQQLDLFRHVPAPAQTPPSEDVGRPVIGSDSIEDEELLAALPRAGLAHSVVLAAEAGRRA